MPARFSAALLGRCDCRTTTKVGILFFHFSFGACTAQHPYNTAISGVGHEIKRRLQVRTEQSSSVWRTAVVTF
jgi:hypothetical protein